MLGRRASNGHHIANGNPEISPVMEDARFGPFRELVFGYWARVGKNYKACPWGPGERRALRDLLAVNPMLTIEHFGRCLSNRELSKVNPSAMPGDWLRRILMFGEGPLNEFDRPLPVKVSPAQVGTYREPQTVEEVAAAKREQDEGIEQCRRDYHASSPALQKILRESRWWNSGWGRAPWED